MVALLVERELDGGFTGWERAGRLDGGLTGWGSAGRLVGGGVIGWERV